MKEISLINFNSMAFIVAGHNESKASRYCYVCDSVSCSNYSLFSALMNANTWAEAFDCLADFLKDDPNCRKEVGEALMIFGHVISEGYVLNDIQYECINNRHG